MSKTKSKRRKGADMNVIAETGVQLIETSFGDSAGDLAAQINAGEVGREFHAAETVVDETFVSPYQVPADLAHREVIAVPVDEIEFSPFQVCGMDRRTNTMELEQNIKSNGLISPPTMRHGSEGKYQLVVGERRVRAMKNLGYKYVPAFVFEMTDQEAIEMITAENFQREDLAPLDAAKQVDLLRREGMSIRGIATRIGKPAKFIAQLCAIAKFGDAVMRAITSKKRWQYEWNMENLAALAGLADAEIEAVFEAVGTYNSPDSIERAVGNRFHMLGRAPWKLDDEALHPKAGACSACPFRSSTQSELFGEDGATRTKAGKNERCLNPACWDIKSANHLTSKIADLEKDGGRVVLWSDMAHQVEDASDGIHKIYPHYHLNEKPKGTAGTIPALCVEGRDPGKIVHVLDPTKHSRTDSMSSGRSKPTKPETNDPAKLLEYEKESLAARKEKFKLRRTAAFLAEVAARLQKMKYVDFNIAVALVASFGLEFRADKWHAVDPVTGKGLKPWDVFGAAIKELVFGTDFEKDLEAVRTRLWKMVLPVLLRRISYVSGGKNENELADARKLCEVLNIKDDEINEQIAKDIPEPKSWAQSEETMRQLRMDIKTKGGAKDKKQKK